MLSIVSCMSFFEKFGQFIACDVPERCLVKNPSEQVALLHKDGELPVDFHHLGASVWQYTLKEVLVGLCPISN